MLEGFARRAAGRTSKAAAYVQAAEAVLAAARRAWVTLRTEAEEANTRLLILRAELATAHVPSSDADVCMAVVQTPVAEALTALQAEMALVREQLAAAVAERDNLRTPVTPACTDPPADVPSLTLEAQRTHTELMAAMNAGDPDAYEKAAADHARIASALARSMRTRRRT